MSTIESKTRDPEKKLRATAAKPKKLTRLCLKCGRVRPIEEYYVNKDWEDQLGRDIWCKQCVNNCTTKYEIKEYFWANNREYIEKIWEVALAKAEKLASNNITYQKSSIERRKVILERLTCQQVPSFMQAQYHFIDNTNGGTVTNFEEAKQKGLIEEKQEDDEKVYSKDFNGMFTKHDLDYLESYYNKLEEDFTFDNESIRDYARKVCKASLQADKAQDAYAAGRTQYSDVKDALAQFDMLSKSANFAACKRKTGDTNGLTSWAETTYRLETTGHTMQRKIEWEKDDVDKTIEELRHIVSSIGLDSV